MNLFNNKKGQGLSLTVIIVAAIALIVLVVLVAIFLGRISGTDTQIDAAANAELAKHKISYGNCHPSDVAEEAFSLEYSAAEDANDGSARESATNDFKLVISTCKANADQDSCIGTPGCEWE